MSTKAPAGSVFRALPESRASPTPVRPCRSPIRNSPSSTPRKVEQIPLGEVSDGHRLAGPVVPQDVPHAGGAVADALLDDDRRADSAMGKVRDRGRVERDRKHLAGRLDGLVVEDRYLDPRLGLARRYRRLAVAGSVVLGIGVVGLGVVVLPQQIAERHRRLERLADPDPERGGSAPLRSRRWRRRMKSRARCLGRPPLAAPGRHRSRRRSPCGSGREFRGRRCRPRAPPPGRSSGCPSPLAKNATPTGHHLDARPFDRDVDLDVGRRLPRKGDLIRR